jgi:rhodanese-related sulfurtransferase
MSDETSPPSELRRILLEALVIFALGALIGLSLNYRQLIGFFTPHSVSEPAPLKSTGPVPRYPVPATLDAVQHLLKDGALPVDARSRESYDRGHLPGAYSLPLAHVDRLLDAFCIQVPVDLPLVVYCSGKDCPDALDLAKRLIGEGYRTVWVFNGGFAAWKADGLPVRESSR